eukprot:evm.model.scf_2359.2 EVM.evm.TU.scf_2359.2   scf_2359:16246-19135(-)
MPQPFFSLFLALVLSASGFPLPAAAHHLGITSHGAPGGRTPLSTPSSLLPDRLKELGVPEGAEILFQLESDCPEDIPVTIQGRRAAVCRVYDHVRGCLGTAPGRPLHRFANCSRANGGCEVQAFGNEATVCIAQAVGLDLSDAAVKDRCNSLLTDQGLTQEFQPEFEQPIAEGALSVCYLGQPEGGNTTIQFVCVEGKPELRFRFNFGFPEEADDKAYSCILNRE